MIKIKSIDKDILFVLFPSRRSLCKTLLRLQESYENLEFRNKVFTLDEFKTWYIRQTGKWSYYQDWSGFNFPSRIVDRFRRGDFPDLSREEEKFLNLIDSQIHSKKFYVIATFKGSNNVFDHEVCHARYYLDKRYQNGVKKILSEGNLESIFKVLKNMTYHSSVWLDESQAYLATGADPLRKRGAKISSRLEKKIKKFVEQYNIDMNGSIFRR